MDTQNIKKFSSCGGCMAKLPPGLLKNVLESIPKFNDDNLLVGFDNSDDAAIYKITDDLAIVQTLDFFPPIVDDPYTFGAIAAANSLSDIYAMGGDVKLALNIVCFPENDDPVILAEILRGGAEKVLEAGGVLCGGHSINDKEAKYGLSVTGIVNINNIMKNNTCRINDKLILTKPLGIGIVTSAHKLGEASEQSYLSAIKSMQTLNKYAAEKMKQYKTHACTDVTGFGFLGHLNEMITQKYSAVIYADKVNYIPEAYDYANEFIITAAGQKNRKHLDNKVLLGDNIDFAMQEILFDPQTSGGLLISVAPEDADRLLEDLNTLDIKSCCVGEIVERQTYNIIVE